MTSITYIGMDVHTTNFTLCCYSFEDDKVYATVQVKPEYIAYADRAADRLKHKYQRIVLHSRSNIAKIAVARELACFIWGKKEGIEYAKPGFPNTGNPGILLESFNTESR
ncbi:MAG: hypothetical protein SOW84_09140 [Candidatus Faecousia sp.]|nr:hypothetical protein [Candidatus Faecousia sp.]